MAETERGRWEYKVADTCRKNLEFVRFMIELCKGHHAGPLAAAAPLSDGFIGEHLKLDAFPDMLRVHLDDHGCEIYAPNLDKDCCDHCSDAASFMDETRLISAGAPLL